MADNVLFSFPGVSVAPPHSHSAAGYLVLKSSRQEAAGFAPSRHNTLLRLQHTPDNPATSPTNVLIEAGRELRKTSPRQFFLSSEFGDITITFPELNHLIPQDDERIDLPAEVKGEMKWEAIVREFESEIDRFVSYRKNSYSLLGSPFGDSNSKEPSVKPYDPSIYVDEKRGGSGGSGSGGSGSESGDGGERLVLVDEDNGHHVGEVRGKHVDSDGVVPGSKDPVEITFPEDGHGPVTVRTADYLKDASDPRYKDSTLVQTAAQASRLIITTSSYISGAIFSGARAFTEKTRPNPTPTTFQPTTHQRFQQVQTLTSTAAKFSSSAVGKVGTIAQNVGARLANKDNKDNKERAGQPQDPGLFNKSLIAFSTVADSIDYASKTLLNSSSQAATQMVQHKYGPEAGEVAHNLTSSVKNVGLVYIDASGVSRRAIVKGVAKGMVVGKVKGGGDVVVSASPGDEKIDGLPLGWGDGPLGGANAGPAPQSRYSPSAYASGGGSGSWSEGKALHYSPSQSTSVPPYSPSHSTSATPPPYSPPHNSSVPPQGTSPGSPRNEKAEYRF